MFNTVGDAETVLQRGDRRRAATGLCNVLRCVAPRCTTLKCVATRCNTLQRGATQRSIWNVLQRLQPAALWTRCTVLQRVVTVLQITLFLRGARSDG